MASDDLSEPQTIPSSSSGNTLDVQKPSPKKKTRRATAVYPNVNSSNKTSKPFSRSAAKRGSVMALGSIEHLQYYFTKAGLAAKEKPQSTSILVPAVGGPQYIRTSPSGVVEPILDEEHFVLPPTPIHAPPIQSLYPPGTHRDYETDPEQLKRRAIMDLKAIQEAWGLSSSELPQDVSEEQLDVLSLLRSTTGAIRSVRNYVVSLPDDTSLYSRPTPKPEYRPSILQPTLTKRPAYHTRKFSHDILYQIRHSALDVLGALHGLEESTRLPLSDEAYDVQSDHGSASSLSLGTSRERLSSPCTDYDTDPDASFSFSVVKVPGREEHIHVWTNEDDEPLLDANGDNKAGWDEKLVLGAGWLYQQDITLGQLKQERQVVGRYLDAVDNVLFGGYTDGKRGWDLVKFKSDSSKRRSFGREKKADESAIIAGPKGLMHALENMHVSDDLGRGLVAPAEELNDVQEEDEETEEEEYREVPDEELPDWARRKPRLEALALHPLSRAHAILVHLLPATLLHVLPLPDDPSPAPSPITPTQHSLSSSVPRIPFLQALSSGQLLCVAYNAAIRRSKKPWGFVNLESVHDVIGMEANAPSAFSKPENEDDEEASRRVGWTFRRTDNLRLWTAALRLRYLIPISSSPLINKSANDPPFLLFDARTVARREPGWDTMLEAVLLRWVEEVVKEKRGG